MSNHMATDQENNGKPQNKMPSYSFLSLKNPNTFTPICAVANNNYYEQKRLSLAPNENPRQNLSNQDDDSRSPSPVRSNSKKASIVSSKSSAGSSLHRLHLSTLLRRQMTLDQSQQNTPSAKSVLSKMSKSFKVKTPGESVRSSRRGNTFVKKDSFGLDNSFTSVFTDQSNDFSLKRQSTLNRYPEITQTSPPKKMSNLIRRKSCHCSDCGGMSKKERANLNLPLPCSRVLQASLLAQSLFFEEIPSHRIFTQKQSRFAEIGSKAMMALKFRSSLAKARKSQENQPFLTVKDAEENTELSQLDKSVTSEWRKSITSSASPKRDHLESFSSRKLQELLKPVLSNKIKISLQDFPEGKSTVERESTASIDLDLCSQKGEKSVETDIPVPSSKFRRSFQNKNRKVLQKNSSIDERMASENNLFGENKMSSVAPSTNHISENCKSLKNISRPKTSSIEPAGKKFAPRPRAKSKTSKLSKAMSIQEIYNNKHPLMSKPRETTPPSRNKFRQAAPSQAIESMPNIEIKVSPPSDSLKPPTIMIRDGLDLLKQNENFGLSKGKSMTCLGSKTPKENHKKKGRKLRSLKAELVLPEKEVFREKVILKSSSKKGFKTFFVGQLKKIYKPRLDQDRLKTFKAC